MNYSALESLISPNRLNSYRTLASGHDVKELVGAYYWNKALSGALFPVLQCVEITYRNAIHRAATNQFGTPAWYDNLLRRVGDEIGIREGWYSGTGPRTQKSRSEKEVLKAKQKLSAAGKRASPPGVVSELSFGFWTTLLNNNFEDIHGRSKLWPNLLPVVFPNVPAGQRGRNSMFQKFDRIRSLRNRLAHHEPLWKTMSVTNDDDAVIFLEQEYKSILEAISFMCGYRVQYLRESLMCREFERLCKKSSLAEYKQGRRFEVDLYDFKRDAGRYLDRCFKKNLPLYLKSSKGFIVRIAAT